MGYAFSVFLHTLSQRLRQIKCWLILLLLPLVALGVRPMTESDAAAPITVGVVLPESGGDDLWDLLQSRSDDLLSFVDTDADTVDRNVASGKWDCGLIFAEDFRQRLENADLDRSVIIRTGPGSTVYPLVQETVSACLAQLVSPAIAREYLRSSGIPFTEDDFLLRMAANQAETKLIGVHMTTLEGEPLRIPELTRRSVDQVLFWLICAVILVRLLFGAADLGKWAESPAVIRIRPLRSRLPMMTARAAAEGLLMILSGCSAMALLGNGIWGSLAVWSYGLFWICLCVVLAQFPRIWGALPLCLPFALVISFLLSSALVDIGLILPALSGLSRWIPASLFLRICLGDPAALPILPAAGLLLLALSGMICRIRKTA